MPVTLFADQPIAEEPVNWIMVVGILSVLVVPMLIGLWFSERRARRESLRMHAHWAAIEERLADIARHLARIAEANSQAKPPPERPG